MNSRWRAELALAGVTFIWGSTFVLVKNALDDVSTLLFLGLRFGLAAMALAILYFARRLPADINSEWKAGVLIGASLYLGYWLQTAGLRLTTPAKSGLITGLFVVVVPLLSAAVYRKVPIASEWLGALVAAAGLLLMTADARALRMGWGDLLTVGCALAFAVHVVALGHYSSRMNSDWLSLLQIGTCAAIGLSTCWWMEKPAIRWSGLLLAALGVTSLLGTALAFWVQTWAQQHTTATRAVLIFSLEPVFAWLTSFAVAKEVLTGRVLAGAICILGGILLVELKPMSSRSHQLP